jgi:hemolysin III
MTKRNQKGKTPTIIEEIANTITHGLGLILSVVALTILLVYAYREGDPWKITAFAIYGSSLTILYLISTLYHSFTQSRVKAIFRRLDHAAIYLLIAGTYTPVILISLRTTWVIYLLPVVWIMAIIGVYIKIFYIHRYERLSLAFYLIMGWMALIAAKPLFHSIPIESFVWIILGGVAYSTGVIFYVWSRLPFNHTIWHGFVLAGSISHFVGILYI